MRVALCLLTLNEIDGIMHDLPLIDRSEFDEIYCVDGGSDDGTVEYLKDNGVTVYKQLKKGITAACLEGVEHCSCDAFVFYHPKGTVSIQECYKFRHFFDEGYDFVVASRMLEGAHNEEDECLFKPRKWFVLFVGAVCNLLFRKEGNIIYDTMHGFRGMTREAFELIQIPGFDLSVDVQMVCRSYIHRLKRIEFPVYESVRIGGDTHFKPFPMGCQVIKYIIWEFVNVYFGGGKK